MTLRTLLFLVLCVFSLSTQAQYQPTAIEGANWIIFSITNTATESAIDHHVINISGDTIINNLVYKKIHKRRIANNAQYLQDFTPPFIVTSDELIGFLRDDTLAQRVYIIDLNTPSSCLEQEDLFYDFALNEGDTLLGCFFDPSSIIDATNQEVIWGEDRQVFFLVDTTYKYIEGIGGREGLFSDNFLTVPGYFRLMVDYCIDGIDDCEQIVVNTLEAKVDLQKIKIFPNPAINIITLKLPDDYANYWIEIINPTGQTLLLEKLTDIYNTIDISALPSGIHYYKIHNGTNSLSYGSIIKL